MGAGFIDHAVVEADDGQLVHISISLSVIFADRLDGLSRRHVLIFISHVCDVEAESISLDLEAER